MEIDCSSIICSIVKILNNNIFSLLKNLHSTADIQLFHQKTPFVLLYLSALLSTPSSSVASTLLCCYSLNSTSRGKSAASEEPGMLGECWDGCQAH